MQQVGEAANTYGVPVLHSGCCPNNLTKLRRIRRRWIVPNLTRCLRWLPGSVSLWARLMSMWWLSGTVIWPPLCAGYHEATTALKQRKSRDADWLKTISSWKRSGLLECELKKMTTVIVSECTALWKEMKSRWKRKLHRRLNRKDCPLPCRATQLTLSYPSCHSVPQNTTWKTITAWSPSGYAISQLRKGGGRHPAVREPTACRCALLTRCVIKLLPYS